MHPDGKLLQLKNIFCRNTVKQLKYLSEAFCLGNYFALNSQLPFISKILTAAFYEEQLIPIKIFG